MGTVVSIAKRAENISASARLRSEGFKKSMLSAAGVRHPDTNLWCTFHHGSVGTHLFTHATDEEGCIWVFSGKHVALPPHLFGREEDALKKQRSGEK